MAISPQGYLLGKDPKNVNPFWGENEDASVNRIFATAEITGGTGTPSVQTSKTIDGNNITFGFSFNNLKGEQGEQGARGLQGETGERGPQGLQGEKGEKGDTGERGPQGIQGETGATGPRGEQGETGPRGQQGEQGPQGVQGIQGEQGPQGERGPQGEKGDPGAAFEISKTYASVAAMEADAENVEEGQFVIISSNTEDPDNAKVYVKNAEGGFTFVVDLSGSQGIQGPRGPQGEQGEQGIQGLQGIQGIQGPAGNDGVTPSITATATADSLSSNNPTVTVTKTGTDAQPSFAFAFSGFKGERGEQGLQGIQGIQGETGATGATGPAGANGQGVPTGGTEGQVLVKVDGTDYNTEWVTPQASGGNTETLLSINFGSGTPTGTQIGNTPLYYHQISTDTLPSSGYVGWDKWNEILTNHNRYSFECYIYSGTSNVSVGPAFVYITKSGTSIAYTVYAIIPRQSIARLRGLIRATKLV